MTFDQFIFYLLAALTVIFSLLVVTVRNPVHSALALIAALISIAGIYLSLGAEFVTGVQILVYVGGIMVLFLFVIMLISIGQVERVRQVSRQWKTALVIALALAAELVYFYYQGVDLNPAAPTRMPPVQGNTQQVGWGLYIDYLLPFEIASVLLLVAIVGAVILARRKI